MVVPSSLSLVDSKTISISHNHVTLYDKENICSEPNKNGTLFYRLDGKSMDRYCGINNDTVNFYLRGMSIIHDALQAVKTEKEHGCIRL